MSKVDAPVIEFWSNQSEQALTLSQELASAGYAIEHVFSGSARPYVIYGMNTYSGYGDIYRMLLGGRR